MNIMEFIMEKVTKLERLGLIERSNKETTGACDYYGANTGEIFLSIGKYGDIIYLSRAFAEL